MSNTRYFLTSTLRNETETRAIITDQMDAYDPSMYRPEVQAGKTAEIAREEWANAWEVNNVEIFATRQEAEAAQENQPRKKIVEITIEDIENALTDFTGLFGDE